MGHEFCCMLNILNNIGIAKVITTYNDKECLKTKQGKHTTTQRSKLKQVYCFKVRQEHKQTKV